MGSVTMQDHMSIVLIYSRFTEQLVCLTLMCMQKRCLLVWVVPFLEIFKRITLANIG